MTESNLAPPIKLAQLPWLNPWQELAYLSTIVMELCVIIPWYVLFGSPSGPMVVLRTILAFGGVLTANHLILRLFDNLEVKKNLRRWVFVFLLVVSLFFGLKLLVFFGNRMTVDLILRSVLDAFGDAEAGIPSVFAAILLVMLTAYRGAALAGEEAGPWMVGRRLRWGLVLLGVVGLLSAILFRPVSGAIAYLMVFLCAGLLGMTAARINIMAQERGGRDIPFDRQRVVTLVVVVLGLVGLAGLSGLLLGSNVGSGILLAMLALGGQLLRWIAIIVGILLYPLIVVFFSVVQWVMNRLALHPVSLPQNLPGDDVIKKLEELASKQPVPLLDSHLLNLIILGGIILVLGVVIVLLIRSRTIKGKNAGLGETEMLLSQDDLLRQMLLTARKNAQSLLDRLAQGLGLRNDARRRAAQRIRVIYTDLLELAASLKHPRWPQQTPLEYLPELQKAFPSSQAELVLITQAYQRIRYGELPEAQDEVNVIENAWSHVQVEGRTVLINPKGQSSSTIRS
jgi:hypothetical protein